MLGKKNDRNLKMPQVHGCDQGGGIASIRSKGRFTKGKQWTKLTRNEGEEKRHSAVQRTKGEVLRPYSAS